MKRFEATYTVTEKYVIHALTTMYFDMREAGIPRLEAREQINRFVEETVDFLVNAGKKIGELG